MVVSGYVLRLITVTTVAEPITMPVAIPCDLWSLTSPIWGNWLRPSRS